LAAKGVHCTVLDVWCRVDSFYSFLLVRYHNIAALYCRTTSGAVMRSQEEYHRAPATGQSNICGYTFRSAFFQSVPVAFPALRRASYSNNSAAVEPPRSAHSFTHRDKTIFRPRPPVYGSNGRSYKMLVMFLFFQRVISELTRPITVKRCHMIGNWSYFIIQLPKFGGGGSPPKNLGPKTCKISVHFTQHPTLIANISGTA